MERGTTSDGIRNPPALALTRSEYYAARGEEPPENGNGATGPSSESDEGPVEGASSRRCEGCGEPFEGRAETAKYCSEKCRKSAHRARAAASSSDVLPVATRTAEVVAIPPVEPTSNFIRADEVRTGDASGRTVAQLVVDLARTLPGEVVAATLETAGGVSITIGRTDTE
jgi:hypothetical protein